MATTSRLLVVLISACLVLPAFLTGCQTSAKNPEQSEASAQNKIDSAKIEQARTLARQINIPAQIAIAGLGQNSTGLSTLKTENANCATWKDQLSGFLSVTTVKQETDKNQELKIALSAVQLVTTGQFLMDIPSLVIGVSSNVAIFPLNLYLDIKKLETLQSEEKVSIHNLAQALKQDIDATKNVRKGCRRSITKYLKSKIGLLEKQCTPAISSPALQKLRDLSVPRLAFNTANEVVLNDTAWTAVQIFAFTHGWTVTEDTRTALVKTLAENPDLGPLVDNGIDVLIKKENADTVIGFLSKIKEANSTCGPKEPIKLKSPSMVAIH